MMPNDEESTLIQLIYVSAATVPFSDSELDELLAVARHNNRVLQVTGILLFAEETFFQVLEGDPDTVHALYQKITADPRHNNALVLKERSVRERNFRQWNMGFIRDQQQIESLPGFIDFFSVASSGNGFLELGGDAKRIEQILEGFRRGRWRRHSEPVV